MTKRNTLQRFSNGDRPENRPNLPQPRTVLGDRRILLPKVGDMSVLTGAATKSPLNPQRATLLGAIRERITQAKSIAPIIPAVTETGRSVTSARGSHLPAIGGVSNRRRAHTGDGLTVACEGHGLYVPGRHDKFDGAYPIAAQLGLVEIARRGLRRFFGQ